MPTVLVATIRPLHNRKAFARVVIHRDLGALRREARKDPRHISATVGLLAYTQGMWSNNGLFCEMHFSKTRLGTNTLSHECYHATQRWLDSKGWKNRRGPSNLEKPGHRSTEEWAAIVHGNMLAALVNMLYAEKLIPR